MILLILGAGGIQEQAFPYNLHNLYVHFAGVDGEPSFFFIILSQPDRTNFTAKNTRWYSGLLRWTGVSRRTEAKH